MPNPKPDPPRLSHRVGYAIPALLEQARIKRGMSSVTVYINEALIAALVTDLGCDADELRAQMPWKGTYRAKNWRGASYQGSPKVNREVG